MSNCSSCYDHHPLTSPKCIDLLRKGAREYYRQPPANCTTWSYFTAFPPPKPGTSAKPTICGLEIYTEKTALQRQVDDPVHFQSYHKRVKEEGLYEKPEDLVAWYLTDGFVARDGRASRSEGGALISVTRMVARDREEGLRFMR